MTVTLHLTVAENIRRKDAGLEKTGSPKPFISAC